MNTSGIINIVAGNDGSGGLSGDGGPATSAEIDAPEAIAVTSGGEIWINDVYNTLIRKVDSSGDIHTWIGSLGDNLQATSAILITPHRVTIDASGNFCVAGDNGNTIRKIDTSGIITTFAGSSGGFSGDGGSATDAEFSNAYDMVADSQGNIYIVDRDNHRIRVVDSSGDVDTFAGNGSTGFSGDGGQATSAMIQSPSGVAVDSNDDLYISDSPNSRVRKVDINRRDNHDRR